MAERDIMPYSAGGMGSHARTQHALADSAATFLYGEPILLEADGQVIEAATQPLLDAQPPTTVGIAAVGAADISSLRGSLTNQMVAYYPFDYETEFKTRNVYNNSDTAIAPAATQVGDACALRRTAGDVWGVDIGSATANALAFGITRVLNDQGVDVNLPGAPSTAPTAAGQGWVVFKRVRADLA